MTKEEAEDLVKCYGLHRQLDDDTLETIVALVQLAYAEGRLKEHTEAKEVRHDL